MSRSTIARRREYDRHYKAGPPSGVRAGDARLIIPDGVERRDVHTPCFQCGVRPDVACRHRLWLLQ